MNIEYWLKEKSETVTFALEFLQRNTHDTFQVWSQVLFRYHIKFFLNDIR